MKSRSTLPSHLIKIGKVTEPRALKGELKVFLFSGEAPWNKKVKNLFLKLEKEPVSFKIDFLKIEGNPIVIKLKGMDDRTTAERWLGAEVFIDEEYLATKSGESIYLREILGFKVFSDDREVGVITGFDSNTVQDILLVETPEKKTVMIPLVKEFIVKIDHPNRSIIMTLPPGLIEVNA